MKYLVYCNDSICIIAIQLSKSIKIDYVLEFCTGCQQIVKAVDLTERIWN